MTAPDGLGPVRRHRGLSSIWATAPGLGRLAAVNHSIVGKRFMLTAFAFFLLGITLAMLMRAQLARAGNTFLDNETYNQIFTMHGTVMMFLFAIPVLEGLALYFVPKFLGARDLAFPRLSAYGYWCYVFGASILVAALVGGVAPNGGWFMYTPLSGGTYSPGINADVWLIGVTFVEISAVTFAVELMVTVLKVRAAGMSLGRMPLFAWYILVTAGMMIVGFPPLILGSILLEVERAFDWPFFDPQRGGDPLLWQHLFWMFGHPEVYIIFLPAAGLVSTIVPVFAGRPIVGYRWIVASIVAVGFISFALWVHHMFTVGIPHLAQVFFSAASVLIAVPTAVQFFAWIATLWHGRPVVGLPLYYLFGFLATFVAGGLTGVMVAIVPFNWQVHDTHFIVAHFHYVLIGGLVFPLLAATYHWLPLVTGRLASETLGKWAFWLIFIGFNLTFLVMHLTGLLGMPRRVYTYAPGLGWELPNLISSVGGFVLAMGIALFVIDILLHRRYGDAAPRNPWRAGTLEWAIPRGVPAYNFASLPVVDGREPLWDNPGLAAELAAGAHLLGTPRNGWQETLAVEAHSGRPESILVLPRPTLLPLFAALATGTFFLSVLFKAYVLAGAGLLLTLAVLLRWAWQNGFDDEPGLLPAGRGLSLPVHAATRESPGWWGTVFTLAADGTLLASLVFGYVYLWAVAPGWPPPDFVRPAFFLPLLAVLAPAAAYGLSVLATRANQQRDARARAGYLWGSALAGLAATALLGILPAALGAAPTEHAYGAVVAVLALYGAFHGFVGAVLAAFAALRCRHGYVSPLRDLDLRVARLWNGYTAASAALIVALIVLVPLVMR